MRLLYLVRLSVVMVSMVMAKRLIQKTHYKEVQRLREEQARVLMKDPGRGQLMCAKLSKEPFFGVDMLIGPTWRIYYTWKSDLQNQCLDMVFRNATPQIINRIYKAMNGYLEEEPYWSAASLLVIMRRARHEMLLFPDPEAAGRFTGVPNVVTDNNMLPVRRKVPLLKFQLKLMHGGKFLLMADCQVGVTTLSARRRLWPLRAEIASIAQNLGFGPGLFSCPSDIYKNEGVSIK